MSVQDRPRVVGVWLHQTTRETAVTVVADGLDEELEFRLRDIFETLASQLADPSVGYLLVYDRQDGLPTGTPEGEQILAVQPAA